MVLCSKRVSTVFFDVHHSGGDLAKGKGRKSGDGEKWGGGRRSGEGEGLHSTNKSTGRVLALLGTFRLQLQMQERSSL